MNRDEPMLHPSPQNNRRRRRTGFSFIEILFAIMILGIGMIMVAAMFPVGIRQTQANVEGSAYLTQSRAFAEQMSQLAKEAMPNPPPSPLAVTDVDYVNHPGALDMLLQPQPILPAQAGYPIVYSFNDPRKEAFAAGQALPGPKVPAYRAALWNWVRGNVICPSDPSYAVVPLFSRDINTSPPAGGGPYAQQSAVMLYLAPLRARTKAAFSADSSDPKNDVSAALTRVDPVLAIAQILQNATGDFYLQASSIYPAATGATTPNPVLVTTANSPFEEGCYVIVSDAGPNDFKMNGTIFRLSTRVAENNDTSWFFARDAKTAYPTAVSDTVNRWKVFVIGRGVDPSVASGRGPYRRAGASQALGILPTLVNVRMP